MMRLLVTGGTGLVGGNLCYIARSHAEVYSTYLTSQPRLDGVNWRRVDITDKHSVRELFDFSRPDLVIHTAALADIDACEANKEKAWSVNVGGTENVAREAKRIGARLIHISTCNVFDGLKGSYTEEDKPNPVNFYGKTKLESERVAREYADSLVVRISMVLGYPRTSGRSALRKVEKSLSEGKVVFFPEEEIRTPIDVWTICTSLLALGDMDTSGTLHLAGSESVSRLGLGRVIAEALGYETSLVKPLRDIPPNRAPRPRDVSLCVERARKILGVDMPNCREAVSRAISWSKT